MRKSTHTALRAFCSCTTGLIAVVGCAPQEKCQTKADIFREHVASADFTVDEANCLAFLLSQCDADAYEKIGQAAAPDPSMET